ncbi:MAG: hypothetical protein ABSB18_04640 [Candidatus Omnitrophota bacterium]
MHKMKNFILFFSSLLFFLPAIAFADSRDLIVAMTLNRLESQMVVAQTQKPVSYNSSLRDTKMNEVLVQRAPAKEIPPPAKPKPKETTMRPPPVATGTGSGGEAIKETFYISAAYDINHIHYSEWANDDKQDEDFGTQRGYYIAVGYRNPDYVEWVQGKPFVEGYFNYFSNIIHYKGATIGPPSVPVDADQRSRVRQYGLKVGAQRDFLDKGNILGYLDVGERIWNRGEDSGNGDYAEKYYWTLIGFGAGMSYKIAPKLSVGFEAEWMTTLPDLRKLHADDIGYGDITFKLGYVWGTEVKLPIKYYILKNLSLDITPYFTYWKIKHSDVDPNSGLYEPDSKTHLEGVLGGFTYSF